MWRFVPENKRVVCRVQLGTRHCCDVKSTSMTLIRRRNKVVRPMGILSFDDDDDDDDDAYSNDNEVYDSNSHKTGMSI